MATQQGYLAHNGAFAQNCIPVDYRRDMAEIRADMVANVMEIYVAEGDSIAVGDTIVLLESMKMEIPVIAETAGKVTRLAVSVGDVVQEGDLIIESE